MIYKFVSDCTKICIVNVYLSDFGELVFVSDFFSGYGNLLMDFNIGNGNTNIVFNIWVVLEEFLQTNDENNQILVQH